MLPNVKLHPDHIYEVKVTDTWSGALLFTPYDAIVEAANNVSIEIGRFSHNVLAHVQVIPSLVSESKLRVGAFCEASGSAYIQMGGEHRNDNLLNFCFGSYCDHYRLFMSAADLELASPRSKTIAIGDNVVLSREALVVNAANIGAGCVIGAGAIVTGKCEPMGIYGGVPARRIRDRFNPRMAELYSQIDLPNIAAHSVTALHTKVAALESGDLSIEEFRASVEYLPGRAKLHLRANIVKGFPVVQEVVGFSVGGDRITDEKTVENLKGYFYQAMEKPSSIRWSPDIFYRMKLY